MKLSPSLSLVPSCSSDERSFLTECRSSKTLGSKGCSDAKRTTWPPASLEFGGETALRNLAHLAAERQKSPPTQVRDMLLSSDLLANLASREIKNESEECFLN